MAKVEPQVPVIEPIEPKLVGKTGKEKAEIKGKEIAKLGPKPRKKVKFDVYDCDIEIVSTKAIEDGVEVYARVWDKNSKQIGFGKDGSVDVERFVFSNPAILVPDDSGTIEREWEDADGSTKSRKLREDPEEAILQDIARVVTVKKSKSTEGKISKGKIGSTTLIARSTAGSVSPVDGSCSRADDATWQICHDAATGDSGGAANRTADTMRSRLSGVFIQRGFHLFTTSSISTDTVESAVLLFSGTGTGVGNADTDSLDIVASAPAGTDDLVDGDYDSLGTTLFASIELADWQPVANSMNAFVFNTDGISAIDTGGISKFGSRIGGDRTDTPPTGDNFCPQYMADQTGTAQDPVLVVEHSASGGGIQLNGGDAIASGQTTGSTSLTISSFTVASGTNSIIVVGASFRNDAATGAGSVTGVTFNGDALTKLGDDSAVWGAAGQEDYTSLWYRVAPDVATGDVVITYDESKDYCGGGVVCYDNVDQSTPFGTVDTTNNASTETISATVSSESGGLVVDSCAGDSNTLANDSGQALRVLETQGGAMAHGQSQEDGAASVTTTWTITGADAMAIVAAPMKAVAAAAGPATLKTLDTAAAATIKTINGAAIATVKTWNTAA